MRETLERVRPITIGQASRIPGVTPAALSLVHVSIRVQGAGRQGTGRAHSAKHPAAKVG
jgi:tRNA uridine 5-carboxymethylaminomethyl modification enzyme